MPRCSHIGLTSDARLHGRLHLVGRADMGSSLRTLRCEVAGATTTLVVVSRSWGPADALIAVHFLAPSLGDRVHELQIYEWGAQLAMGDASCEDGSLELLVGERTHAATTAPAALFTLPISRCD